MEKIKLELMKETIDIAVKNGDVFVGIIIANNDKVIFSNEYQKNDDWADYILHYLKKANIKEIDDIYLTINTYKEGIFNLNKILDNLKINQIYIGLPDPKLNVYLKNDPMLQLSNIHRYPENLQKLIIVQNKEVFSDSVQNIKYNTYYSKNRISEYVKAQLSKIGFFISKEELESNKTTDKLAKLLIDKYKCSVSESKIIVNNVLADAFNNKYALYEYKNDVRSINNNWSKNFYKACRELSCDLVNDNIIDIGVGSGNEASEIFKNCKCITFVDIAPDGLKKIKDIIPHSNIIVSPAENLEKINDNEYDVYISLRTFNSSFFDIDKALKEAKRILKEKSGIIISIANGFLSSDSTIIPGLIIPGTEFVDIYKCLDTIKKLINIMSKLGFENFKVMPSNEEIYLLARLNNKE